MTDSGFAPFSLAALSDAPPPTPLPLRGSTPRSLAEARQRLILAEIDLDEIQGEVEMLRRFLQRYAAAEAIEPDDIATGDAILELQSDPAPAAEAPSAATDNTNTNDRTIADGRSP